MAITQVQAQAVRKDLTSTLANVNQRAQGNVTNDADVALTAQLKVSAAVASSVANGVASDKVAIVKDTQVINVVPSGIAGTKVTVTVVAGAITAIVMS